MKTSKEEILRTALTVFAERGYDGTYLRDIAERVGITKPAIYKHFANKEALWNAMIDSLEVYYRKNIQAAETGPAPKTKEELRDLSLAQIDFTMQDPTIRTVRRFLIEQQFRDERMAALATKHFDSDMCDRYTAIFAEMMAAGTIRRDDPALLAFVYTAPISHMILRADREPQNAAAIEARIRTFINRFIENL